MTKFSRMRVQLTRILLPVVTIFLCVLPGQSYAFVPAAVGGYGLPTLPTTGTYAAASGSAPIGVGAAAFVIGMAIGYYGLEYLLGDGMPQHVRIPLTSDPLKVVPPPVVAPVPQIPEHTQYKIDGFTGWYDSFCTAIDALLVFIPGGTKVCNEATVWADIYVDGVYNSSRSASYPTLLQVVPASCPTGRTLSGTECVAIDPRAVAPDNSCDFARSGSSLSVIADPDCEAALAKMPFICANGTCTGQGTDASGQPLIYAITPRSDGGSTITTTTQKVVNGQTQLTTTTSGVGPGGLVDSVSGDVQAGSIPGSSTGSATTPVTTNSPTQQPSSGQTQTFPSDYARTGEAASAATQLSNAVNPKLDTIHHDLSDTATATDPTVPTVSDMPTWGNTFDALKGWTVPGHSSVCPTPSMDLSGFLGSGNVFVMNSHCTLLDNNKATLQGVMTAVFTVLALFLVLRA